MQAGTVAENNCVQCHLDTWDELKVSVHARHGIYCNSCHGGDPAQKDKDLAKAEGTGYIGVPDKKQIADKCGTCHSDVGVMNFYGIRTDQLAQYKTSVHGKKLFQDGDDHVAVCSDCHGYHDIVAISETTSPVYPANIPNTCNSCHGSERIMAPYGLPTNILETYRGSVHGKALFEKHDLSAAQCASCHGSHGAVPPGVREAGETCGKCHVNEKKYFLESVHAKHAEAKKFSECVSCHGNHGVQHATPELYKEACQRCHEPGSPEAQQGESISQLFHTAGQNLAASGALVKQASIEGIFVEEEMSTLEEAKTHIISMAPVQHTLLIDQIKELYGRFEKAAQEISASIYKKRQNLKWRKIALIPLWIFILIMAVTLHAKYKKLKHHHESEKKSKHPNG